MCQPSLEYYKDDVIEIVFVQKKEYIAPLYNHHGFFRIILVLDGVYQVQYKDKAISLHSGDILAIPPNKVHTGRSDGIVSTLCISVHKDALQQKGAAVLNLIDDILENLQRRSLIDKQHIIKLSKAASQMVHSFRNQEDRCPEFVTEAKVILEKWPEINIAVDKISEHINICRSHLIRTFKKEVGLTPHQFHIHNRVRKASYLLLDSDNSIEIIRKECGFYDKSHFKRHFRRLFGMTPNEYRLAYKGVRFLLK